MADGTLNKKAIFSDGTADFVSPCEPRVYENVTIRCRVGKDEAEYVKAMVDEVPYIMHLEKSSGTLLRNNQRCIFSHLNSGSIIQSHKCIGSL